MDVAEFFAGKSKAVERRMGEIVPRDQQPQEVYEPIWDLIDRGGKRLRPAMCLLSCEAFGGKEEDALGAAAAIEMFHNFTLIHDDIEDNSQMRRGSPCLHIKYGLPIALNAGDGLFMMVWKAAMGSGKGRRNVLTQKMLLDSFTKVLEGQAIELGWYQKSRWDIGKEDYIRMVEGKTGALISASCAVGACLGGAKKREMAAMGKFGMNVGVAFQIQDDVLNIVGEEEKYRKEIGGDINEGKRTLILIEALQRLRGNERERLASLMGKEEKSKEDVDEVILLLRKSGGVEAASREAQRLVEAAKKQARVVKDEKIREVFHEVADYLVRREV